MRDITLLASPPDAIIQVDGDLDAVNVFDLRRAVDAAIRQGCSRISLDLSRVPRLDNGSTHAVLSCRERVRLAGGELTVVALSGPIRDDPAHGEALRHISRRRRQA
jgi:anti-anti-sigma factor